MDRSQLILSAIDELRQIRSDIGLCSSLDMVRRSFERLQEIRRQHLDDFDLQIIIADAQQEIIERARSLRTEAGKGSATNQVSRVAGRTEREATIPVEPARRAPASVSEPQFVTPEEPPAAEIPADVPKLDRKSWQLAVGLAILFTVGIFASFFYLIQTARRLNFTAPPAPVAQPVSTSKSVAVAAKTEVAVAAPAPVSMTPTLRLYTDLTDGTATIDDHSPKDLVDGELNIDSLAPGEHSLRIESRSGSAAFTFSIENDKDVPHVTNILKSNNAMVVLVAVKNDEGRLSTDAEGAQIALDEKPAGVAAADGLFLPALGTQDHDLEVSRGRDKQKFVLTYTPAPTLTVFVKSDPSTGVLTISTGQDGVSVFINDFQYKRVTDHGALRIPLKVGNYRIRVHKAGFQDPAVQTVDVRKSAEAAIQFHMLAEASEFATLLVKGATPGTVIYVEHQMAATVGVDGTAKVVNVKPGVHMVELHHDAAVTKQLARSFEVGQTITLTGADVALDRLAADNKSIIPANPGPAIIPPPEVPQLQPAVAASATGEQVHKGGGFIPYHTPRAAGRYYFQAHAKLGGLLKKGKLQWYAGYQDKDNYILFMLDGKHAEVREMRAGKLYDLGKIPFSLASDEWVQVELSVKPDVLEARTKSGSGDWTAMPPVSTVGRDYTKDSVGIYVPSNDEVAVANFRFSGH